ncbi:sce7725 family protein [Sphingopyxis sp. P1IMeth2]|uniref:sce7725 family protein n=1 Tax=Sphingopyxis sp. P1IMeth2 TaxID=1892848 RepID=UPI0016456C44|nr:sce7725 family protein [Sphingopyxis sp. P1IMeth2]
MYHPYFRGKQYELITIRENAELMANSDFIPIIEPVKEALSGLARALTAVCDAGGNAIVIVNPYHGDYAADGESISEFLEENFSDADNVLPGILLREGTTVEQAMQCIQMHQDGDLALIHAGFTDGVNLSAALGDVVNEMTHIFVDGQSSRLYRRHFPSDQRVLVRDGFQRRRNRDHPPVEFFSDLHITFGEEGMQGFGDFLTVGDDYSESGGPAYAIAIHLTFIDPAQDNAMFIHHFLSERQDTPTDPAGKFAEALDAMITELDRPGCPVFESRAVEEFRRLHEQDHFPGLGYVKKLSMQHHIETLVNFFD